MTLGVVIGKFYPPHRGHRYLIDTAVSQCDEVLVIIVDSKEEDPPAKDRYWWIKEIHPDVDVELINDIYDNDNSEAWAKETIKSVNLFYRKPRTIDKVFTSEAYGDPWAQEITKIQNSGGEWSSRGTCEHVFVGREYIDVSATQVRENPGTWWPYLEPVVRQYYCKRIVVVGAESTGTTTMAKSLAAVYQTTWVPEYGRDYTIEKYAIGTGKDWLTSDFVRIAVTQQQNEDLAARKSSNGIMFCDTDVVATTIWHERYMGFKSAAVQKIADSRHYPLYLLTDHDIPFEAEEIRDGEHIREWMTNRFVEVLNERKENWVPLQGSREHRLQIALTAISQLE